MITISEEELERMKPYINVVISYLASGHEFYSRIRILGKEYEGEEGLMEFFPYAEIIHLNFKFYNLDDAYHFANRIRRFNNVIKVEGYCQI